MDKHTYKITQKDGSTQEITGVKLCNYFAIHQVEDTNYSIDHLPTGATFISLNLDSEAKMRMPQLQKVLNFFTKYGTTIDKNYEVLASLDINTLTKTKNVKALHKLFTFLVKRIRAYPLETMVGCFYRDEADFQKLCAKTFKTQVIYSGDALMSPQVITDCILEKATIEGLK